MIVCMTPRLQPRAVVQRSDGAAQLPVFKVVMTGDLSADRLGTDAGRPSDNHLVVRWPACALFPGGSADRLPVITTLISGQFGSAVRASTTAHSWRRETTHTIMALPGA